MTQLENALSLAGAGFRVLPLFPITASGRCGCGRDACPGAGKHPRLGAWQHRATTEQELIREWWGRGPDCGVGIATGRQSGVWVLDVDVKSEGIETLAKLEKENGPLPLTPTVITGSGGLHYYFHNPDGLSVPNRVGFRPGLDVRGEGGYVVAPGSPHACGKLYEWEALEEDDVQPAAAPVWLLKMVMEGRQDREPTRADQSIAENRNDTLMRLGCSMRSSGFSAAAILRALEETNASQCKPPLEAAEVAKIAESCGRYKPGVPDRAAAAIERLERLSEWSKARPPLERNSDVILGRELLAEISEADGVPPVFDEGGLWRYSQDSGLWKESEEMALARAVQAYEGRMYISGYTDEGREKLRPLGLSANKVAGAIKAASAEVLATGFFEEATPGICCTNGFLRIGPGGAMFSNHAPRHRAQVAVGYAYNPAARCERWTQFLCEVFAGPEVEQRAKLLQEFAGAALVMGLGGKYQKCLVMTGEGSNGKSQAMAVISALIPPSALAAVPPQKFGKDYDVAALKGVMLNAAGEIPDGDIAGSDRFKSIISSEPIQARHPYGKSFRFTPKATHFYSCNSLPGSSDHSQGYWRRFCILRWDQSFKGDRAEAGLAERIIKDEIEGVALWAIAGAVRLMRQGGYTVPDSSKSTLDEWKHQADQVAQFVAERCQPAPELRSAGESRPGTPANSLYGHYCLWAQDTGCRQLSRMRFCQRLASLGFKAWRRSDCRVYPLMANGGKVYPWGPEISGATYSAQGAA